MKYIITNQRELIETTLPAFRAGYTKFLGEKTDSEFQEVVSRSMATSIVLDDDNEVQSFCFHRHIKCDDWRNPPQYLNGAPELFLKYVEKFDIMSMEWLTVAPKHIGKFTKVQPADVTMGLCFTLMRNSFCQVGMGFSRQDIQTDKITMRFGTRSFGTIEKFGIPCSVILIEEKTLKAHPILKAQQKIEQLWNERENHLISIERKKVS